MGTCMTATPRLPFSKTVLANMRQMLSPEELRLLHLAFRDLADRTVDRAISREDFCLFFHKHGLWGEQLFREFARGDCSSLSEEEFVRGIARIAKSSETEKIGLLFKFFSRGQPADGVPLSEFLTMLYNYPKEDLRTLLSDHEFVEEELKQRLVLLEHSSLDGLQHNTYYLKSSNSIQCSSGAHISHRDLPSLIAREVARDIKGRPSQALLTYTDGHEVCEIRTSNVQQLVRQFARHIFKEAGIDPRAGRLTSSQFASWVQAHRAIYQNYYDGFHQSVWETDNVMHKPRYLLDSADKTSEGRFQLDGQKVGVRLFLHGSLLVVAEQRRPERAVCVICLEGLIARRYCSAEDGFGLEFSHRDGIYPQKRIYLRDEALQREWMKLLHFYRGETVQQKYEIGAKIGTGKFSVVYRCRNRAEDHSYALKEIATFKLDPQVQSVIAHESSIMQVLSHPLLLRFKECLQTRSHIYIVTELVQGSDLFDFVRQQRFLEEYDAAKITQQLIVGLRYLHSFQIVHRDLKPENILVVLDQKQQVASIKIIDFGFSTYLSRLHNLPPQERLVGTPNYIAPEVLREEPLGFQIDTFAVGVILFYMLTGLLPFNDYALPSILDNTLRGDYAFPDRHALSPEATDLAARLLHNDPQQRISLEEAIKHPWFGILKQPRKPSRCRPKLNLLD